jgi:hypothetical protein
MITMTPEQADFIATMAIFLSLGIFFTALVELFWK